MNSTKKNTLTNILITVLGILTAICAASIIVHFVIMPAVKYNTALSLYEEEKYDEATKIFTELDGFLNSKQKIREIEKLKKLEKKLNLEDWKKAYLKFVTENKEEKGYREFALIYVDDDDIPELFIRGSCEALGETVCTYNKNSKKVESISVARLSGVYYCEKGGLILHSNGHMGNDYIHLFELKNGNFYLLHEADKVERAMGFIDELTFEYSCLVDGVKCDKATYDSQTEAWIEGIDFKPTYNEQLLDYKELKVLLSN